MLLLGILLAIGCSQSGSQVTIPSRVDDPDELAGPDLFHDITAESGISFVYRNGEDMADHLSILESLGGGAG